MSNNHIILDVGLFCFCVELFGAIWTIDLFNPMEKKMKKIMEIIKAFFSFLLFGKKVKANDPKKIDEDEVKETLRSDKVIIEMTNKSKMDAHPAGAAVAFYNGDKLVDCQYVYCTKSDDPLEVGDTVTEDIEWIGKTSVDSVTIYPNAMSNGTNELPDSLEGDLCKEDFLVGGDAATYWTKNEYSGNSVTFKNTNDITEMLEKSGDFRWVYYSPEEDESKEGIITTARGIHLGDSKDAVFKAYGKGKEVKFNPEKDSFYNQCDEKEQGIMKERATKSVEYQVKDEPYRMVFYFDSDDKVSMIFYAHS